MPIKNNDDVAHLLDATGRAGSSYREFDNPADHVSAPLIDAVFSSAPPHPADEDHRPLVGGAAKGDLLSEVFDRPKPKGPPAAAAATAPGQTAESGAPARAPSAWLSPAQPSGRSLSEIRRIITQPSEAVAAVSSADSLNGLFDRLAG
jgi:hypothetical protein